MRIFIYEYASALHAAVPLPAPVRVEGRAMLSAFLEDFTRIPGVEVLTLRDQAPEREPDAFRELARSADGSLLIAPEFDDLLETRCRWVEEAGGRLLGPSAAAVRHASDKWTAYQLLCRHAVPTPSTWLASTLPDPLPPLPWVRKLRRGAGSQEMALLRTPSAPDGYDRFLHQEYRPGQAASVAFLIGPNQILPLLPAYQFVSADGHFHYQGGQVPLPAGLAERALALAGRAVRVVPGLRGYVGVDLILGADAGGRGDAVLEINPRPTTSYVGLRRLALDNLADILLRVVGGESPGDLRWRQGSVTFQADGTCDA
jgi:predicted ATP-grasp superfamily ATP-dependent carboligase